MRIDLQAGRSVLIVPVVMALCGLGQAETFRQAEIKPMGSIDYGQTTKEVQYTGKPRFAGYAFNAQAGDRIEVWVRASGAKPAAYLTDAKYETLTGASDHFATTIPAHTQPSTYYILVYESAGKPMSFTLELERPSKASAAASSGAAVSEAVYLGCSADAECVAVDRAGCCHNGYKDAVNQDHVADYKTARACQDRHTMCAMYLVKDERVAICNTAQGRCEMLKPEELTCGGLIRNAHQCPSGYSCRLSPIPDAGGQCVKM